ncbi:MAG TPA: hypothetical protein VHM23_13135 [Actinomycetota bacterium]|nr:hypothetical protein [Actinomycetota bacterium]
MDGSLRRRGRLLVVVGALLGAVVGVTLGLVGDDPGAGTVAAAPAPDRGMAVAAAPPGSQPPTSRTVGGGGDGPAARPGKAPGKERDKTDKARSEGRGEDKPGEDKPGKDKKPERD